VRATIPAGMLLGACGLVQRVAGAGGSTGLDLLVYNSARFPGGRYVLTRA
jgi:hypothetical protein